VEKFAHRLQKDVAMYPNNHIALAAYYRMTAVVYVESAKMLEGAFVQKGQTLPGNHMAIPFYLLISHAAELYLKCALLKRGTSPEELKGFHVRHNLNGLLDRLTSYRVPISERSKKLLAVLSEQHRRHDLRYTVFVDDGIETFTPEPSELYELLDELLMAGRIATHGI
jgi:hypothetical protein